MIYRLIICVFALMLVNQPVAADEETTADSALKNVVAWTTATEVNSFGYDVFRGDSESGPFVKLNKAPLPGAGTVDTPQSYQFVDDTIEPNTVYYYYVESISMDGVREQMTPIFSSKPKSRN